MSQDQAHDSQVISAPPTGAAPFRPPRLVDSYARRRGKNQAGSRHRPGGAAGCLPGRYDSLNPGRSLSGAVTVIDVKRS